MARVHFINPEFMAAYPDLPEGHSVGRRGAVKFHALESRMPISLPTVSIVFSGVETTEADYRRSLAGQAAAERAAATFSQLWKPKHRPKHSRQQCARKRDGLPRGQSREAVRGGQR